MPAQPAEWLPSRAPLSPVLCAAHGWTRAGQASMLACTACNARLSVAVSPALQPPAAAKVVERLVEQLRTEHRPTCPHHGRAAKGTTAAMDQRIRCAATKPAPPWSIGVSWQLRSWLRSRPARCGPQSVLPRRQPSCRSWHCQRRAFPSWYGSGMLNDVPVRTALNNEFTLFLGHINSATGGREPRPL